MLSERDVVSGGLTHNVSEGKQTLHQDQRPSVLSSSKDSVFLLFISWELSEAEFKGDELICLVEEISRQNGIQDVAWLLLTTLNLGLRFKRATGGAEGHFSVQFTEAKSMTRFKVADKAAAEKALVFIKEMSTIKEKLVILH